MKIVFMLAPVAPVAPVALLAGCNEAINGTAQQNLDGARVGCRDGVEYLQFRNSYGNTYTAHLRPDGKPYTCAQ